MKIELPLVDVPVKGRLHITYPMIVLSLHPDGNKFIYNYFINLECHKNNIEDLNFCFITQASRNNKSWIYYLHEHKQEKFFAKEKSLILELINYLNQGYYIYIYLDEYYISRKEAYCKDHFDHINFIYGYHDRKKLFYLYGYDENSNLRVFKNSFEEIEKAYTCNENITEFFKPDLEHVYDTDISQVCLQLNDFLLSKNSLVSEEDLEFYGIKKDDYIYGIEVYNYIIKHLEFISINPDKYDARNLYILWEHKKLMRERIKFFMQLYNMLDFSKELELAEKLVLDTNVIKNKMLKWKLTLKNSIIFDTQEKLNTIMKLDKILYEKLLIKLNNLNL